MGGILGDTDVTSASRLGRKNLVLTGTSLFDFLSSYLMTLK